MKKVIEMVKIKKAEYVLSAAWKSQWPQETYPEMCLAGRSNVGKSSFINAMLNRNSLAKVSSTPGKTRTLNFFNVNDALYFVDVPGYGYAKVNNLSLIHIYIIMIKDICVYNYFLCVMVSFWPVI